MFCRHLTGTCTLRWPRLLMAIVVSFEMALHMGNRGLGQLGADLPVASYKELSQLLASLTLQPPVSLLLPAILSKCVRSHLSLSEITPFY